MDRYKKVSSLCLVHVLVMRTTVSIEYFQLILTLYLPNFATNGRLAEDCIELCKVGSLFFSSFDQYIHLTMKLGTVPSNFVQSMKLNIDVVKKIRKVEQVRPTHVYSPTLKCLGLPPRSNVLTQTIRLRLLLVIQFVSTSYEKFCAYPLSTLILDLFYFWKIRREDYSIECKAFMFYNSPSLYRVLDFVLGIFLESGLI